MSVPALRQPKRSKKTTPPKKSITCRKPEKEYVILTLKDDKKLVVTSDGYHGIIKMESMYLCVLCETEIDLDDKCKAEHKNLESHLKTFEKFPHLEGFVENLVRQLNKNSCYCTICNVMVSTNFLMRHVEGEAHKQELERAGIRASVYKPK
ncbi:unnamed protein product [Parnassius mnemosyne]|uniref:C2H2-type domain-containing protein n=1 Tax=Parnassius mnemosyne TaxID=213953 RepID=A0AAV1LCI1_9NEOP